MNLKDSVITLLLGFVIGICLIGTLTAGDGFRLIMLGHYKEMAICGAAVSVLALGWIGMRDGKSTMPPWLFVPLILAGMSIFAFEFSNLIDVAFDSIPH